MDWSMKCIDPSALLDSFALGTVAFYGAMSELATAIIGLCSRFNNSEDAGLGHLEESLKRPMHKLLADVLEKTAQETADRTPPICRKCRSKLTVLGKVER